MAKVVNMDNRWILLLDKLNLPEMPTAYKTLASGDPEEASITYLALQKNNLV